MKVLVFLGALALATALPAKEKGNVALDKVNVQNKAQGVHPLIVNGDEAPPHSVPHQCWLYVEGNDGAWVGGGVLITSTYVLSAGHMVAGGQRGNVLMGAHNVNVGEPTQRRIDIARFIPFPNYNPDGILDDMGLVQLVNPVQFTPEIQPIRLINPGEGDLAGRYARASGWGGIWGGGPLSDVLRYIDVRIMSNGECHDQTYWDIHPYQLCIAGDGKTVCQGDSGGPLTIDGGVAGVTSYVAVGCPPDHAAVYTRVSSYWDWIIDNSDLNR